MKTTTRAPKTRVLTASANTAPCRGTATTPMPAPPTTSVLTTPVWITVSYLGEPDHGVIIASYIGSWLMAGGFLAVGSFTSAISKNQIVAFVVSLSLCFVLVAAGFPLITEWAVQLLPEYLVDTVSGLSFFTHYLAITKGVLDLRDLAYFIVVIVAFLTATGVVIQSNR